MPGLWVYTSRSTNKGETWDLPKCLDAGNDNGPVALAGDEKGSWLLVWQAGGALGTDSDLFVAGNSNSSWSAPALAHPWQNTKALNRNASNDQGYDLSPDVTWNGTGKWVVVWSSDEAGPSGANWGLDWDILKIRFTTN